MSLPYPALTPEEAAALIENDQTIGFSGFTPAGSVKAIPKALAARAIAEHSAGRAFKRYGNDSPENGPFLPCRC